MTKYRTDSAYAKTPIVNEKFLGIWEPGKLDIENTATMQIKIEPKFNQRPDVLANELYGNPKLWWVFAQFNPDELIDPILDFQAGLTIVVPTRFS